MSTPSSIVGEQNSALIDSLRILLSSWTFLDSSRYHSARKRFLAFLSCIHTELPGVVRRGQTLALGEIPPIDFAKEGHLGVCTWSL